MVEEPQAGLSFMSARSVLTGPLLKEAFRGHGSSLTLCVYPLISVPIHPRSQAP